MLGRFRLRLKSIARAFGDFLLATATARLIVIAKKLWANLPLLAIIVVGMAITCLASAALAARGVFGVLAPASPSGIGAVSAAMIAALLVLELCSATGLALIEAALQLADDTGRHRVHALLTIASAGALAAAVLGLWQGQGLALAEAILPMIAAAGLWTLTLWFQRAYRRPAYKGFRDFRSDIAEARHFLMRAAHGG